MHRIMMLPVTNHTFHFLPRWIAKLTIHTSQNSLRTRMTALRRQATVGLEMS